ncbi:HotDog domain-containing protein [Blakeslea trispora]|nr:HotDog domain-containing protein [Blakeslea trispora]
MISRYLSLFKAPSLYSFSSSSLPYTSILLKKYQFSTMSPIAEQPIDNEISPEEQIRLAEIERDEIVKKYRADPELIEYEAYANASASQKAHSLTATTLRGPGMIIVPPVMFYNKTYTEATFVLHLGTNVCGHDGIVHGGLAATVLDEGLACVAIPALPNNFGFTANLNVNYRKPIFSNQWIVMRSRLDKLEDRKAFVSASLESVDGETVFTEATSLYVSPKVKPQQ